MTDLRQPQGSRPLPAPGQGLPAPSIAYLEAARGVIEVYGDAVRRLCTALTAMAPILAAMQRHRHALKTDYNHRCRARARRKR